jgi:hypothetical protein
MNAVAEVRRVNRQASSFWLNVDDKTGSIRRADNPPIWESWTSQSAGDKSSADQEATHYCLIPRRAVARLYRILHTAEADAVIGSISLVTRLLSVRSASDAVDGSSTGTVSAKEVGAVKAPTIRRSQSGKRSQRSVSILRSRYFRYPARMRKARCSSAAS